MVKVKSSYKFKTPVRKKPDPKDHYHTLKTDSPPTIGFPYIGRSYRLFTYGNGPNVFPKPK